MDQRGGHRLQVVDDSQSADGPTGSAEAATAAFLCADTATAAPTDPSRHPPYTKHARLYKHSATRHSALIAAHTAASAAAAAHRASLVALRAAATASRLQRAGQAVASQARHVLLRRLLRRDGDQRNVVLMRLLHHLQATTMIISPTPKKVAHINKRTLNYTSLVGYKAEMSHLDCVFHCHAVHDLDERLHDILAAVHVVVVQQHAVQRRLLLQQALPAGLAAGRERLER